MSAATVGKATVVGAFFGASILLAEPPKTTKTETTITTTTVNRPWTDPANRWQKATDLVGKNVNGPGGENIGEVDEVIIDLDSGRVLYYVIGCDGKDCAVPAMAITLPADAKQFTVPFTEDQMEAYAFAKGNFPNFKDRTWATQLHTHYKVRPVWESGRPGANLTSDRTVEHVWYRFPARVAESSDLIGMNVKNHENENIGEIVDLAVDPDGNRVLYGVLSFGGFLGMGDKLFAIPWNSLKNISPDQKHVVLNIEKDRLKNAKGFDKDNWPNMADKNFASEVHTFYGAQPYWVEP
jgi:sporulation protein YlmC with PRC-barrel domain